MVIYFVPLGSPKGLTAAIPEVTSAIAGSDHLLWARALKAADVLTTTRNGQDWSIDLNTAVLASQLLQTIHQIAGRWRIPQKTAYASADKGFRDSADSDTCLQICVLFLQFSHKK